MNKEHKALFNRNEEFILKQASAHFDAAVTEITKLGGFESVVFEYISGERSRILKATHTDRRSLDMIKGELDWVNHMIANGVPCVAPVKTSAGKFVITVPVEDSAFHLYAWEKAPGVKPNAFKAGEELWRHWGAMLGKMHSVTKSYQPSRPEYKRQDWLADLYGDFSRLLRADADLLKLQEQLTAAHKLLHIDPDSFGLVHADLHQGNFFVDNGKMTIFDFDDCYYTWFAHDIAMPLFYFLSGIDVQKGNTQEIGERFFREFMIGYRTEFEVSKEALATIPLFLRQRELVLYMLIGAEVDWKASEWCSLFMTGRREALLADKPIIEFDPTIC